MYEDDCSIIAVLVLHILSEEGHFAASLGEGRHSTASRQRLEHTSRKDVITRDVIAADRNRSRPAPGPMRRAHLQTVVPSVPGRPTRPLDAREQRILERVRTGGRITNAEARTLVDIADVATMRRVLRRMVRAGLLIQRGTSKRHTYYEMGPNA